MRILTILIAVSVMLAVSSEAAAQYFQNFAPEPTHRFDLSFRAFNRPNDKNRNPAVVDATTNTTLLLVEQVTDLGGGLGPDLSYVFATEPGCQYEVRGFFIDWETDTNRSGTLLTSPEFPGITFLNAKTNYRSEMFSIELNQRRDVFDYFTAICGVRYVSLEENLDLVATTVTSPTPGIRITDSTETKNSLIGFQVGGESTLLLMQGISVELNAKFGAYSNNARLSTVAGTNVLAGVSQVAVNHDPAFLAEYGMQVNYDLILNQMSIFLGYDGLSLINVATAPNNNGRTSGVDDDTAISANGIKIGVSYRR